MAKTTLTISAALAVALQTGAAGADYNSNLRARARTLVQQAAGERLINPKYTIAISVYKANLKSLLENGYINMRLSAKYPKTDELYDHLRSNKGAPRPLFIRESTELDMAVALHVEAPGVASWFIPELFPKYGLVGLEDSEKCSGNMLAPGMAQTRGYGDIWIQLKKDVNTRATFTLGDSLDDKLTPAPLAALTAEGFEFKPRVVNTWTGQVSGEYVEAQIWGPITAHDVAAIWVTSSATAGEVKAVADAFAIPVKTITLTAPRLYKDCVAISATTTPPDAPTAAGDQVAALKREYAEIMTALRGQLRQPSIDRTAWEQLQARRMRTLYYFVTKSDAGWDAIGDGGTDELARQDQGLLGLFRAAVVDLSGVAIDDVVDRTVVERRFLPRGTSWNAFLGEVAFWCQRGARSASAAVAATLSGSRAADGFELPAALAAYEACDTTGTARSFSTRASLLALASLSKTPGASKTELGEAVAVMAAAIGVPTLAATITARFVTEATADVQRQWRDAKSRVLDVEGVLRRETQEKDRLCAGLPEGSQLGAVVRQLEDDFAAANRACNSLQSRLENTDPEYSKLSGAALQDFRSKVLPGLKAKDPDCIKAAELGPKRNAAVACEQAWQQLARTVRELPDRRSRVEELRAKYPAHTQD